MTPESESRAAAQAEEEQPEEEQPKEEQPPVETTAVDQPDRLAEWAALHIPFVATVVLVAFVVIRVLRVSNFDPATGMSLVQETGVLEIVLGVLVTALPNLLWGAAFFLVIIGVAGPGSVRQRRAARTLAVVVLLLLFVVWPWLYLLIAAVLLLGIGWLARRFRGELEIFAVLAFVSTALLDVAVPWLPPERIELDDGRHVVGYVLSADDQWTTLLRDSDRAVVTVRTSDVETRQVCNLERVRTSRTLGQVLEGEPGGARNPPCHPEDKTRAARAPSL